MKYYAHRLAQDIFGLTARQTLPNPHFVDDAPTLASLHRLIARQGLIIGQHITGDEGLLAALKQLPEAAETVENG